MTASVRKLEWASSLREFAKCHELDRALLAFARAGSRLIDPGFDPPSQRFDWSRSFDDVEIWRTYDDHFREGTTTQGFLVRSRGQESIDAASPTVRTETLSVEAFGLKDGATLRLQFDYHEAAVVIQNGTLTLEVVSADSERDAVFKLFERQFSKTP